MILREANSDVQRIVESGAIQLQSNMLRGKFFQVVKKVFTLNLCRF